MAGRTIQIVNAQQQRVAMLQKSLQTLIMNASLGAGSEMTIDIAQGVSRPACLVASVQYGVPPAWLPASFLQDSTR